MKSYLLNCYFRSKDFILSVWYILSKLSFLMKSGIMLNAEERFDLLECALPVWYHDFSNLGAKTKLIPFCGYREAQNLKDSIIDEYLKVILSNKSSDVRRGFELFCSDGYYSHYFARYGYNMLGVDLCEESGEGMKRSNNLEHARLMQRLLGDDSMTNFRKGDVFDVNESFDLIVNIGGLYHVGNPVDLIKLNIQNLNKGGYLIIQSIVADVTDRDYFRCPAPGWNWGCRFSYSWLLNELRKFEGVKILDEQLTNANYNRSVYDRKYCSFLLQKL